MSASILEAPGRVRTAVRPAVPLAVLALGAALPTLAWGLLGGGFLTDDWSVWLVFDELGVVDGLHRLAFEQPARPLAAPYYALLYLIIGDLPVVQAILLAVINAGVVLAAWAVGRRWLPATLLWPALVVLALAPNHAATRFWFVVGTYPLALVGVLVGLLLLDLRRPAAAAALFVGSTLLYEGPVVLGLGVAGLWALCDLRVRARDASIVVVPTAGVALLSFLLSPKRGGSGPAPFDNAETFLPGQMGTGLWGSPAASQVAGAVVLISLAVAVAGVLPSFRRTMPHGEMILLGAALTVIAAVPFFISGSIFATTGVFDRNNLVPNVGVALLLGALWAGVNRASRSLGVAVAAAVIGLFAVLQVEDLLNWRQAVEHGEELVAAMGTAGLDSSQTIVVVPGQPEEGTGVADFIYDGDLQAALRFRHGGDWSDVRLIENADCSRLRSPAGHEVVVYDWSEPGVVDLSARELMTVCTLADR